MDTPDNLTARLKGNEALYVQVDAPGADAVPALQAIAGVTRVTKSGDHAGVPSATRSRASAGTTSGAMLRGHVVGARLGPAGAAAGAHEPRRGLPQPHDRGEARGGRP